MSGILKFEKVGIGPSFHGQWTKLGATSKIHQTSLT